MEVTFGISERGNPTLLYGGFEFWREKTNKNGTSAWKCCKSKTHFCKARVHTLGNRIVNSTQTEHSHEGNPSKSLARKAMGEMKDKMGELSATPSTSQAAVLPNLPEHVLMALPKVSLMRRTLGRKKQKLNVAAEEGSIPVPPLPRDHNFDIPLIPDEVRKKVMKLLDFHLNVSTELPSDSSIKNNTWMPSREERKESNENIPSSPLINSAIDSEVSTSSSPQKSWIDWQPKIEAEEYSSEFRGSCKKRIESQLDRDRTTEAEPEVKQITREGGKNVEKSENTYQKASPEPDVMESEMTDKEEKEDYFSSISEGYCSEGFQRTSTSQLSEAVAIPKHRKRGRPRKINSASEVVASFSKRRKVGRPRKLEVSASSSSKKSLKKMTVLPNHKASSSCKQSLKKMMMSSNQASSSSKKRWRVQQPKTEAEKSPAEFRSSCNKKLLRKGMELVHDEKKEDCVSNPSEVFQGTSSCPASKCVAVPERPKRGRPRKLSAYVLENKHAEAVVEARFDDMNSAYLNYKSSKDEASTLGKNFSSGLTLLGHLKLNKYATEAALLEASIKCEPTVESMDLPGNSTFEMENYGIGESEMTASSVVTEKRKTSVPGFGEFLSGAVQATDKLSKSIIYSRDNEKLDETLDEDWLFTRALYLKLRSIPEGREKDMFKLQTQCASVNLLHGPEKNQ